jgi:hypothetical protein
MMVVNGDGPASLFHSEQIVAEVGGLANRDSWRTVVARGLAVDQAPYRVIWGVRWNTGPSNGEAAFRAG